MAVRRTRFVRSVVAGLALLLTGGAVATAQGPADPPGTVMLNATPVNPPDVKVLGASPAGVLYSASGAYETGPWMKPTGAAPIRVPGFTELAGSMLFGYNDDLTAVSYRTIADPTVRTCPIAPGQDRKFLPTGWIIADDADTISLVTAGQGGCTSRPVITIPNSRLLAADRTGFAVEISTTVGNGGVHDLQYRTFANPARAHLIDTGDRVYNYVNVSGKVVAWASEGATYNEVFAQRWTLGTGRDPAVRFTGMILSFAVTGSATAYAACDDTCRAGTIPAGGGVASQLDGVRSLAGDGKAFYLVRPGTRPAIYRGASLADPASLERIVTPPLVPANTMDIALGASLLAYRDDDSTGVKPDWAALHHRSYTRSGTSIDVTAAVSRGAGSEQLLGISGGRILVRTWDEASNTARLLLRIPGAADRLVFASTDEHKLMRGPFVVSGTRVLWTRSDYSGDPCDPGCPQYDTRSAMVYDLRTGTSTRLGDATRARFTLWGPYVVSADEDGGIQRQDLVTGRTVLVKPSGAVPYDIGVWGPYVAWSQCSEECRTGLLVYRNVDTMAPAVQVTTPSAAERLKVTGGHIVYTLANSSPFQTDPDLRQLRIGATTTTRISDFRGATETGQYFDAHDEVVAWVGRDGSARIAANTPYVDRPRYLGNPLAAAQVTRNSRWTAEFPISKALPTCSVTIRSGSTVVRTLGCATETGRARVSWDGRNAAGQVVPTGRYSWTLTGNDEDGALRWWNGQTGAITGSLTVV